MVIAICGFMGSGKSTFGKYLAQKLETQFCDTDDYIEDCQKQTIPQIFDEYGEEYFRRLEYNAICELATKDNIILALGGGLPVNDKNKEVLKKCFVLYIDCTFEECYQRIINSDRPIVKQKSKEALYALYKDRLKHYHSVADFIVTSGDMEQMAKSVMCKVKEIL